MIYALEIFIFYSLAYLLVFCLAAGSPFGFFIMLKELTGFRAKSKRQGNRDNILAIGASVRMVGLFKFVSDSKEFSCKILLEQCLGSAIVFCEPSLSLEMLDRKIQARKEHLGDSLLAFLLIIISLFMITVSLSLFSFFVLTGAVKVTGLFFVGMMMLITALCIPVFFIILDRISWIVLCLHQIRHGASLILEGENPSTIARVIDSLMVEAGVVFKEKNKSAGYLNFLSLFSLTHVAQQGGNARANLNETQSEVESYRDNNISESSEESIFSAMNCASIAEVDNGVIYGENVIPIQAKQENDADCKNFLSQEDIDDLLEQIELEQDTSTAEDIKPSFKLYLFGSEENENL